MYVNNLCHQIVVNFLFRLFHKYFSLIRMQFYKKQDMYVFNRKLNIQWILNFQILSQIYIGFCLKGFIAVNAFGFESIFMPNGSESGKTYLFFKRAFLQISLFSCFDVLYLIFTLQYFIFMAICLLKTLRMCRRSECRRTPVIVIPSKHCNQFLFWFIAILLSYWTQSFQSLWIENNVWK